MGTTSLTLYDRSNMLIAVVDVAVGPDVIGLKRQLSELMPGDGVGARMSNDSIVLEGMVSSGPAADRAVQVAETYAPGKVINLLSIGSAQQVMLEVRFSEIKRGALKDIGFSCFVSRQRRQRLPGRDRRRRQPDARSARPRHVDRSGHRRCHDHDYAESGQPSLGAIVDSFGILTRTVQDRRAQHRRDAQRAGAQGRRSPRWPSRPWSRCPAKPRASSPAANSRSRSRRAAPAAAATPPSRSSSSRSASAWPSRRRCWPTA